MSDERERTFLARWALRKRAARAAEPAPEPVAPAAVPAAAQSADAAREGEGRASSEAEVELPPVDTLKGLESEYRDFMRPEVDESLRRAAMKRLFADPHFNVMDGLDVYIDDYSKPDPIPQSMVRALVQSRSLFLFDEEKPTDGADSEPQEDHAAPQQSAPRIPSDSAPEVPPAEDAKVSDCPATGTLSHLSSSEATKEVGNS